MLQSPIKGRRAQNTTQYAILISLVVAGIIAMQAYAQRSLQQRIRNAGIDLAEQSAQLSDTVQYEPYYLETVYNYVGNSLDRQIISNAQESKEVDSLEFLKNAVFKLPFQVAPSPTNSTIH